MPSVYAAPLPFSNKQQLFPVVAGQTLRQIVDLVTPAQLRGSVDAIVLINGQVVTQERWKHVRPKEQAIVNINIIPRQGGGGKKSPLSTLITIAALVAAPYAASAFGTQLGLSVLGGMGPLTAGQSAFFGGIVRAAVSGVGFLLSSALSPPPRPSNAGVINNPAESPTQFIEGASNAITPYGIIPVCLGTNRMFPPQAARSYTETQDSDQYARQLFTYGYGNLMLSDLKIGETAISEFTDITIEHRLAADLNQSTGLYSNAVAQENYSVLLNQVDGYTLRTTSGFANEIIVDFTFPSGLSQFNDQGTRSAYTVQVELQYAPTGTSNWSAGVTGYKSIAAQNLTTENLGGNGGISYSKSIAVIDSVSAEISLVRGPGTASTPDDAQEPVLPQGAIRLSTVTVKYEQGIGLTIDSLTDDRQPSLFGGVFQNAGDFLVSDSGGDVHVAAGGFRTTGIEITASQTEALRKSVRVVIPEPTDSPIPQAYDVRVRRITADTADEKIIDKVYLTAVRAITHTAPVSFPGLSGSAIRIKATDQLNGAIDQYNVVASNIIPDYDEATDTWVDSVTSSPASIYRYVLQGAPNFKAVADSKIDIAAFEDWHTHCVDQGYTYNRVIDYETNVDAILADVAAAGAAAPAIVDGKRTIVIDRIKSDVVQIFTPRNTWDYHGEMVYPVQPHAFRVQFRNAEKGYNQDERIVYDDGYDESNATEYETLELQSCTNSDLAFKTARRHLAAVRLRPETHTFMVDVENIVALRGDRVRLEHDVPVVGVGDGRVKSVTYGTDSPQTITGFTIDDVVSIPDSSAYYVRARLSNGTQIYCGLVTTPGETSSFTFATPITDNLQPGDLCYFVEAGGELDLIITRIDPQDDFTARLTCINYAPEIFTAESAPIPPFESKITTPLSFIRPLPPVLLTAQSDEGAMIRSSDGTVTSRAIFSLQNQNQDNVDVSVKIRVSGSTVFTNANVLEATPTRVILTGLQDGTNYDIHIRYRRVGASTQSLPLQINSYKMIGATGSPPSDVTGFAVTISDNVALLRWDANDDIDFSHYELRFSGFYSGVLWTAAQPLIVYTIDTHIAVPFQGGTYFIKAIDIAGLESVNATEVITYDPGTLRNVIEVLQESPGFTGVKVNCELRDGNLILADTSMPGYYYFANSLDLGDVYTSTLSALIKANGVFTNNLYSIDDVFALTDVFGSGNNDVFDMEDLFAVNDVFGIGEGTWATSLQYRITNTDPGDSPPGFGEWLDFEVGSVEFRAIEFRLALTTEEPNITPSVSDLGVVIDMPDRIERGEDITVPALGVTITYDPPFMASPAVAITLQNATAADSIEYISKTASGFTFKVYNTVSSGYVSRTFDYIASGYGRQS